MKHIAIFGYGTVGGGVTGVFESYAESISKAVGDSVNIKYILDLRDFPDSPYADRVVHDIDVILEDSEVSLVAETMGGAHPAFEFSMAALEHGKHVVTSNKEVVAAFGDKLLGCAAENGVSYLFEASVGGGIPVIRPFLTSLAQEKITSISGILNGTTNFILTKMRTERRSFDDVLREAQMLGYSEKDPSADIDGIDAKRKIIILGALATGILAEDSEVYTETISNITPLDMDAAQRMGRSLKLIGTARIFDGSMALYVCPQLVKKSNILANIDDVYNGISVNCDVTGDIMFYGRGAGRYPTAGAVAADITAALSGAADSEYQPSFKRAAGFAEKFSDVEFSYYFRVSGDSVSDTAETFSSFFDDVEILKDSPDGKTELICSKMSGGELDRIKNDLGNIESMIRLLD